MDRKAIAKRLIDLRGDKTQREVALSIGVSPSAMAMYESGERIPRDEVKLAISQYYGVSISDIFFADNVHLKCTSA